MKSLWNLDAVPVVGTVVDAVLVLVEGKGGGRTGDIMMESPWCLGEGEGDNLCLPFEEGKGDLNAAALEVAMAKGLGDAKVSFGVAESANVG